MAIEDGRGEELDRMLAGLTAEELRYIARQAERQLETLTDETDYLAHPYGVAFVGPLPAESDIIVRGYLVPHLTAFTTGDRCSLVLDHRMIVDGTDEEVRKWVAFIADCMAVAADYPSHGAALKSNRYHVRAMRLDARSAG